MMTMQDPLGLIRQMYPKLWGPGKVQEMRRKDRLSQISEIQQHWKQEDRRVDMDEYKLKELVELVFSGNEIGVEEWGHGEYGGMAYLVGAAGKVYWTDDDGIKNLMTALREREKGA